MLTVWDALELLDAAAELEENLEHGERELEEQPPIDLERK